jgi:hypothetical protein
MHASITYWRKLLVGAGLRAAPTNLTSPVLAFGAAGAACVINVLQHPHLLAESDRIRRAIIRERLPADHLAERDAASYETVSSAYMPSA